MNRDRVKRTGLARLGLIAVLAAALSLAGIGGQEPPPPAKGEQRKPDEGAVRQALSSFVAAFEKGDAKAVAAHWTEEGEYLGDDGAKFTGRAALEKEYADLLGKGGGGKLEVEVNSIRFPSRDTAVVEGHFKLNPTKGSLLVVSRCSLLFAREDGKWLIAIAREWPGDGLALRDLEWLIGTWEVKRDGTTVRTTYEWTANKSFIRCQFSVAEKDESHTGMQMIGKDPVSGILRIWTFEDSGGISHAEITRDGKKWVHTAGAATPDGQVLAATNILTPIDTDSFLWQTVDRWLDDEPLPDLAPVKVTRVKTGS